MSEDNTIRAIVIGVFLFMFIFTITAIIMYYNAAVGVADTALSTRVDFDKIYEEDLKAMEGKIVSVTEIIAGIRKIPDDYIILMGKYDPISLGYTMYVIDRKDNRTINEANLGLITRGDNYEVDLVNFHNDINHVYIYLK